MVNLLPQPGRHAQPLNWYRHIQDTVSAREVRQYPNLLVSQSNTHPSLLLAQSKTHICFLLRPFSDTLDQEISMSKDLSWPFFFK